MNTPIDRPTSSPVETRRTILGWLTGLLGAAIGAILAVPALGYVLSPLRGGSVIRESRPTPFADRHRPAECLFHSPLT